MTAAELDAFEASQAAGLARFDEASSAVVAAAQSGDRDALVAAIAEQTAAVEAIRAGQRAIIDHLEDAAVDS